MTADHVVPVILLTGRPGIGKTTAIRHVVEGLGNHAGEFRKRYAQRAQRVGERALSWSLAPSPAGLLASSYVGSPASSSAAADAAH